MWPFSKPRPTRLALSDYTSQMLEAQYQAAAGQVQATAHGAVEFAAGIIGRSLSAAHVEGTDLLTPDVLRDIGRALITRGDSWHLFELTPRTLAQKLTRASWATVYGAVDPETWRYSLTLSGPSKTTTRVYPRGQVLHVQYASHPTQPWLGLSPLQHAVLTGTLAARLEASLGREAAIPVKRFATTPTGIDDSFYGKLRGDFNTADKGIVLQETTKQGHGLGQSNAPPRDWQFDRIGPEPTAAQVTLYEKVYGVVLECCGVPSALSGLTGSTGGALLLQGIRILQSHTIGPLAKTIAAEASRVLETEVRLTFHELNATDVRVKAQTLKLLMDAPISMAKAEAMALVGLV